MLVHVEIPGMSLNLQDPLLRLTGIHPRQTGGPLFCQILTDFARGGRRANSTPGPARGSEADLQLCFRIGKKRFSHNKAHIIVMKTLQVYFAYHSFWSLKEMGSGKLWFYSVWDVEHCNDDHTFFEYA